MKYHGLSIRDYLMLKQLRLSKDMYMLEIGVGISGLADKTSGRIKEYHGVDISCELIDLLSSLYKNTDFLKWHCLDVCKSSSSLNKKFDVILSADTLEHVESPLGYFKFIKKHLKPNGVVTITYPNESKNKHHGITWFNNKKELLAVINKAGLEVTALYEAKKTIWHKIVRKLLWDFPKAIISRSNDQKPQTFEKTKAFKIVQSNNIKTKLLAFHAHIVTEIASILPPYKQFIIKSDNITNKALLIHIRHK